MKKLAIIAIGLLNFTFAAGQTYSSIISDQEIYDFLNWMTVHDKKYSEEPQQQQKHVYYKILSWNRANFIAKDTALINKYPHLNVDQQYLYQRNGGTDTLFKQQDRDYLFKQFTAIKDTIWHREFSKSELLMDKKQKLPNRYHYSIPLFSVDKKYVIIHRQYYCGNLCAHGGYYVYRQLDGKNWEFVTAVNTWIS